MQVLNYYTIKVVYSSLVPAPVLDPKSGVASSSLPINNSLLVGCDSEELMGQDILHVTKIQHTVR